MTSIENPSSGIQPSNTVVFIPKSLPPISQLFKESWIALKKSILSLIAFNILAFLLIFALFSILMMIIGAFLGASISSIGNDILSFQSLQGGVQSLQVLGVAIITGLVGIFFLLILVFLIVIFVVNSGLQAGTILIANKYKKQIPFGKVLKKVFILAIPLFIVNLLLFLILLGGFFVFIIPAIVFNILFIFASFEVVLNEKRLFDALRSSMTIVTSNFGGIFVRILVLLLLLLCFYLIEYILMFRISINALLKLSLSIFINIVLPLYAVTYMISLYNQAREAANPAKKSSLKLIFAIVIIGWLVIISSSFVGYSILSSSISKELYKNTETRLGNQEAKKDTNEFSDPKVEAHARKAMELFGEMIQIKGSSAADIRKKKELNDESIKELKEALKLDQKNTTLWNNIGIIYSWPNSIGGMEDSLVAFKKAEENDPTNITYINLVGKSLVDMERYEDAILQFQKTLRLTNESGDANFQLGIAYRNLKIYDSARDHFKKAIEIYSKQNKDGKFDEYILQARKHMAELPPPSSK